MQAFREIVNGQPTMVTRYLVWEGDELLLEINPVNGAVATRHVWGAGGYQGYYRETSLTRLALRDGLGHVRGLMNTSKTITDRYVFDAYGNDVAPGLHNTTEGNAFRFRWNGSYGYRTLYLLAGQQSTNTATLMHVGARHYSPSLHRWLQRDPIGLLAGDPNLYRYTSGNPVNQTDPAGLDAAEADEFVKKHRSLILEQAKHFQIPAVLLAGTLWAEIYAGGQCQGVNEFLSFLKFVYLGLPASIGPAQVTLDPKSLRRFGGDVLLPWWELNYRVYVAFTAPKQQIYMAAGILKSEAVTLLDPQAKRNFERMHPYEMALVAAAYNVGSDAMTSFSAEKYAKCGLSVDYVRKFKRGKLFLEKLRHVRDLLK